MTRITYKGWTPPSKRRQQMTLVAACALLTAAGYTLAGITPNNKTALVVALMVGAYTLLKMLDEWRYKQMAQLCETVLEECETAIVALDNISDIIASPNAPRSLN